MQILAIGIIAFIFLASAATVLITFCYKGGGYCRAEEGEGRRHQGRHNIMMPKDTRASVSSRKTSHGVESGGPGNGNGHGSGMGGDATNVVASAAAFTIITSGTADGGGGGHGGADGGGGQTI